MANEKQNPELDALAFEIFKQLSNSPNVRGGEQQALAAYRKAEAFMTVRDRVRSGEAKVAKQDAPILAECFCPNLKRTHPYNLVSQKMGSLDRVNRIKKWLDANPTPESDTQELVDRMKNEFSDLEWDLPTINTARAVFPEYSKS